MVKFINDQVIVATADGNLTILNEKLILKQILPNRKKLRFSAINSLSGSENFIASGDYLGTIRFYNRGEKESKVNFNIEID